jgi:hypothetical protein
MNNVSWTAPDYCFEIKEAYTFAEVQQITLEASFQRLMEKLMDKIINVIVYLDDLLVHSQTHEQHFQSLETLMQRLEENNMKIKVSKCFFRKYRSKLLGIETHTFMH